MTLPIRLENEVEVGETPIDSSVMKESRIDQPPSRLTPDQDLVLRQVPHGEQRRDSRIAKGERGIWQRRHWEHLIRDEDDLGRHVDYTPLQPGRTRACGACRGLAVFHLPPLRDRRPVAVGLGCGTGTDGGFGERG